MKYFANATKKKAHTDKNIYGYIAASPSAAGINKSKKEWVQLFRFLLHVHTNPVSTHSPRQNVCFLPRPRFPALQILLPDNSDNAQL